MTLASRRYVALEKKLNYFIQFYSFKETFTFRSVHTAPGISGKVELKTRLL